jgi:hypothetical protein
MVQWFNLDETLSRSSRWQTSLSFTKSAKPVAARVEREHQWPTETVLCEGHRLVSALASLFEQSGSSATGTRAEAIAPAAKVRAPGKSYVDLWRGLYYRKSIGKTATKKRQPPAPLPLRLLAHMRRWDRLGIAKEHFVEYNGKPVLSGKKAFTSGRSSKDQRSTRQLGRSRRTRCATRRRPG